MLSLASLLLKVSSQFLIWLALSKSDASHCVQFLELVESVAVHWLSCSVENKRTVVSILVWNELGPFFLELLCELLGSWLPRQKLASRLQSHVSDSVHGDLLAGIWTHWCLVRNAVL